MSRTLAFVIAVGLFAVTPHAQRPREITFDDIARPKPGEWPSYNGLLTANRHSPLAHINTRNVATLEPKWTHEMGGKRALQLTPLVVDGIMYVAAVNEARALDARTGRQLWQFVRPQTPGLVPTGDPAAGINRAIAVLGNRLFLQTDHAHVVALDRHTGQLLWDVEMADYRQNYGATGALLIVNDLVIAGISAGDEGVRGFLDAYKASTGERVWRFWTIPARGEPGSDTWVGKALEHGCATTWLTGSYDREARLLYWPTGNPCPDYNGEERKGDNLYSSSIVALDPTTGTLRWHFQFTPHDLHDWDANQPPLLVDANFRGRQRKLLVVANRNGFFYVLDRLTGQLLMAQPFVKNITWASGIGADGRPILLPPYENSVDGTQTCPSVSGAANWPSSAFNPSTGLFYVMASEACSVYRKNSDWFEYGKSFYGGTTKNAAIEGGGKSLRALDLQSGKLVWEVPKVGGGVSASGVLSTAGGLVFYGDNTDGALIAVDAKTGLRLWKFDTQQVWKSSPMTYAIDGKQYVGVVAGSTVRVFGLRDGPVANAGPDYKTWKDYGGGADSSHFVDLTQITKSNVNKLEVAWIYPTGDQRSYVFNPIIVDNVMYVLARNSSLVALDAATGREIWIHDNLPGLSTRGIAYWESKDRKDRRLIFTLNHHLQEIDALTGKSILTFGTNGLVDLRQGLGRDPKTIVRIQPESPGRVFENLILLGSSTGEAYMSAPGDIRAFDVLTGKMVWSFHTIPHPGEEGYDTWPKDAWKYAGGTNTWGEITVDEKRGIAYFPTGSPTYDYYGADRIGSNLFGNCLLALDARTGKRLWHYQMVHHDLWDYDNNAAPQLITVRHNGKTIDAVSQATKQGFLFVFDRITGKPLWPIEERPVPASRMPGEQAWPTQPHPTVPPPYARQKMTADDVNPFILTAEERAAWKDRISKMRNEGLFTPPGFEETLSLPGARGGSNWGTGAANPTKGIVYLTTQDWPTIYKLSLDDPLAARPRSAASLAGEGRAIYETRCQSCHGPNGEGAAGGPPAVAGKSRLELEPFRQVVTTGRAEMPAFPDLNAAAIAALHTFLVSPSTDATEPASPKRSETVRVGGSGGAPGGLDIPAIETRYTPLGGPPYPDGVDAPPNRYYTDWGLYPNQPYIIGPPWSAIVAYDLNRGTIKWRVPLGEDARAVEEGAKNAGVFMAERHGMILTSTGLLFVATTDGKVRAHDADTGKILWTGTLPAGSEGLPSMYEVNGRQYLVVPASSRINTGGGHRRPGDPPIDPVVGTRSYVAFALP